MKKLIFSASQIETYDLCKRKWYFDKVMKLPQIERAFQTFGTVLHAVGERYLEADDNGYDKDGKPVELYPKDWHIATDRYKPDAPAQAITPMEQTKIKQMVAKAIAEGVWQRRPNRQIEHSFFRQVLTEKDNMPAAWITGLIDVLYPDMIEDHKTTKAMKWAKTPKTLKESRQMRLYAMEPLFLANENNQDLPKTITLRHNVFCKDPNNPKIKKVEAQIEQKEIVEHWREVEQVCFDMRALKYTVEDPFMIDKPEDMSKACNAFGGCPFASICTNCESIQGYKNRLSGQAKFNQLKGPNMSNFMSKFLSNTPPAAAPTQAPAANPLTSLPVAPAAPAPQQEPDTTTPAQPQVIMAPAAKQDAESHTPPWADPNCVACGGAGYNSKGGECRICRSTASKQDLPVGEPVATATGVQHQMPSGEVVTQPIPNNVELTQKVEIPPAPQPAPLPTQAAPAVLPVQQPVTPAPQPSAPAPVPVVTPAPKPGGKKGRPTKGFILLIGCAVCSGAENKAGSGRKVYDLHDVFHQYGKQMAEENGVASYYDLNAFERRDRMAKVMPIIADQFKTDMVVCNGDTPDIKVMVEALIPLARMVIRGV